MLLPFEVVSTFFGCTKGAKAMSVLSELEGTVVELAASRADATENADEEDDDDEEEEEAITAGDKAEADATVTAAAKVAAKGAAFEAAVLAAQPASRAARTKGQLRRLQREAFVMRVRAKLEGLRRAGRLEGRLEGGRARTSEEADTQLESSPKAEGVGLNATGE